MKPVPLTVRVKPGPPEVALAGGQTGEGRNRVGRIDREREVLRSGTSTPEVGRGHGQGKRPGLRWRAREHAGARQRHSSRQRARRAEANEPESVRRGERRGIRHACRSHSQSGRRQGRARDVHLPDRFRRSNRTHSRDPCRSSHARGRRNSDQTLRSGWSTSTRSPGASRRPPEVYDTPSPEKSNVTRSTSGPPPLRVQDTVALKLGVPAAGFWQLRHVTSRAWTAAWALESRPIR